MIWIDDAVVLLKSAVAACRATQVLGVEGPTGNVSNLRNLREPTGAVEAARGRQQACSEPGQVPSQQPEDA